MLHAIIIDGRPVRVVDSPTELHRMPVSMVREMCADLRIPLRGALGYMLRIEPITPDKIVAWDATTEVQAQPLMHSAWAAKRAARRAAR